MANEEAIQYENIMIKADRESFSEQKENKLEEMQSLNEKADIHESRMRQRYL